jgi:hypothetical protein
MDDQRKELRKLIAQLRLVQGVRSTTREYRNLDEQNDARTVTSVNECKFGCGLRWPLVSSPVG